jgi:hypothetical protein
MAIKSQLLATMFNKKRDVVIEYVERTHANGREELFFGVTGRDKDSPTVVFLPPGVESYDTAEYLAEQYVNEVAEQGGELCYYTRAEGCSYPNKTFCDCDWCRMLSEQVRTAQVRGVRS